MGRHDGIGALLGSDVAQRVQEARILVVGAGGIGCELLKALVQVGFQKMCIVDLDTIDVSNLNRQFLFRKEHVGMPKAVVARRAVLQWAPALEKSIGARHGNIFDAVFGVAFYRQFDCVLNALDNVEARRHVNRMCVALQIPLIESGTGGYAGQVKPILPGFTECFDCYNTAASSKEKTYPVCTIRNTPDKPVHCIVWSKYLFLALFGLTEEEDDHNIMGDLTMDLSSLPKEHDFKQKAIECYTALFIDDIEAAASVRTRWEGKRAPTPLPRDVLEQCSDDHLRRRSTQGVQSIGEAARGFVAAFEALCTQRYLEVGKMVFDKDDPLAMWFVACASNLRMEAFGIERLSEFDIKGIAGNIIHAVATTNAIAAGLVSLQALRLFSGSSMASADLYQSRKEQHLVATWIRRVGPMVLQQEQLVEKNPLCNTCSDPYLLIAVDTNSCTLDMFARHVLLETLGLDDPYVDVVNRQNFIELDDEHYMSKVLNDASVRINDGSILEVADDDRVCKIVIQHADDVGASIVLSSDPKSFLREKPVDEELELAQTLKRSIDDVVDLTEPETKRPKTASTDSECVILL